jgi:hypothetical protein
MHMRRWMIKCIEAYFEPLFANYSRHIIPNALGLSNSLMSTLLSCGVILPRIVSLVP